MAANGKLEKMLILAFESSEKAEKGEPLRTWKVAHAIPRKWSISDLNANENSVVVETLELSYRYFTIQD